MWGSSSRAANHVAAKWRENLRKPESSQVRSLAYVNFIKNGFIKDGFSTASTSNARVTEA